MSLSYTVASPETVTQNFVTLSLILQDFSLFLGLVICLFGFFQFKRYGESRTMMSAQHTMAEPLVTIFCGIMLTLITPMIQLFNNIFLGTSELIAYTGSSGGSDYNSVQMVITFVRVIGIGALMNGLVKLSRTGRQNSQQGSAGKALLFILGGVACTNCVAVIDLLFNFFDLPSWSG